MIGKGRTGVLMYQMASGETGVLATPDKELHEQLSMFDDIAVSHEIKIGKKAIAPSLIALFFSDRKAKIRYF